METPCEHIVYGGKQWSVVEDRRDHKEHPMAEALLFAG